MAEMFKKKGFCFIEVISPCPTLYQRRNKMGDGLDTMKFYKQVSKIKHGAPTNEWDSPRAAKSSSASSWTASAPTLRPDARASATAAWRRYIPAEASRMQLTEIRIAGFGGQGVIMCAR